MSQEQAQERPPCEVPGCDERSVDLMFSRVGPQWTMFHACAEHVAEFTTPVEPAPPRQS